MKIVTDGDNTTSNIDHNGYFWFIDGIPTKQVIKMVELEGFSGYLDKRTFGTDHLNGRAKSIADLLNRELFAPHTGIYSGYGSSAFVSQEVTNSMFEDADDSALLILAFEGGDLFDHLSSDSLHPHDLFTIDELESYPALSDGPASWQITQKMMTAVLDIHNLTFVQDTNWYGSIISTGE